MKIFKFKHTNYLWVTTKVVLQKFWTNIIYKIWIIQIINKENGKQNEKSVIRRWKFWNLKTPIPFKYVLMYLFWNFEEFFYIKYEVCKL